MKIQNDYCFRLVRKLIHIWYRHISIFVNETKWAWTEPLCCFLFTFDAFDGNNRFFLGLVCRSTSRAWLAADKFVSLIKFLIIIPRKDISSRISLTENYLIIVFMMALLTYKCLVCNAIHFSLWYSSIFACLLAMFVFAFIIMTVPYMVERRWEEIMKKHPHNAHRIASSRFTILSKIIFWSCVGGSNDRKKGKKKFVKEWIETHKVNTWMKLP